MAHPVCFESAYQARSVLSYNVALEPEIEAIRKTYVVDGRVHFWHRVGKMKDIPQTQIRMAELKDVDLRFLAS